MSELTSAREHMVRAISQAADTVGYQTSEHGTLVFFVVAASSLFLMMLRTLADFLQLEIYKSQDLIDILVRAISAFTHPTHD